MDVKARNHGRNRIGMSYFGIGKRWDFIIDLDSLCMSFRLSNNMEAATVRLWLCLPYGSFDNGNVNLHSSKVLKILSDPTVPGIRMAALHKSSHSSCSRY